jgi:osmoprotectant transport system ATP-binding protein
MIRLEAVTKRFAAQGPPAVDRLDLEVPAGATCVLVGPSGCGKTTTMKMINRLVEPTSGRILLGGRDVTGVDPVGLRRGIGYVIQQVGLFPHMTIAENIATVPSLLGWAPARVRARVDELLDLVGLDPADYGDRHPRQLSGGQRQRVGVARALAADPPVMLMDEPFGAVDPITRERLQREFLAIQARLRKTVVFVTHDVDEAVRLADLLVVLRDGRLAQAGAPADVLARPADRFVAEFLGADRLLKRLGLITAAEALAAGPADEPAPAGPPAAPIRADASLAHALSALLASGDGRAPVVDGAGRVLGELTLAHVAAAMRAGLPAYTEG